MSETGTVTVSEQPGAVPAAPATEGGNQAGSGQAVGQGAGQGAGGGGDVAAASSGPTRNPDGTFAKAPVRRGSTLDDIPNSDFEPGEKKGGGVVAKPIKDGVGVVAPAAPVPAKFKFAGKEYDTQDAAEQAHRTLQGMFKPQQETIATLRRQLAELQAATQAVNKPPAAAPEAPAASKPPAGPMDGIDLALYKQIAQSQGPEAAAYWLVQEALKGTTERLEKQYAERLDQAVAPYKQTHEQGQMLQLAENLVREVASYTTTDETGNPAPTYPELYDGDSAERIGHIWANLPISNEARNTPTGMYMAICIFRDQLRAGMYGQVPSPGPSSGHNQPGDPAPQAPTLHPGSAEAAAAVAAALGRTPLSSDAISGGSYPANRGNGVATEADLVRAGIDKAREINRLTGVSR